MTALHVEGLDLCRKSAQQDWLIDGVCHEPLRSFRNILRLKKALLIFKTKNTPKPQDPQHIREEVEKDTLRPHTFILMYLYFRTSILVRSQETVYIYTYLKKHTDLKNKSLNLFNKTQLYPIIHTENWAQLTDTEQLTFFPP